MSAFPNTSAPTLRRRRRGRAPEARVSASETIAPDWWKAFGDPYLDGLVAKAIAGNFDLKMLAARIAVANALIGEAQAGRHADRGRRRRRHLREDAPDGRSSQYDLGTQVSWEIDIWGKVEKGVQAQTAEYRATEADWRAGYLTLVSACRRRTSRSFSSTSRSAATAGAGKSRQILAIYEAMRDNGLVPATQVLRQRAEINRLTNDLLELQRVRDVAENALATLIGVPAGEFKVPDRPPPGHACTCRWCPPGLPSQLLARRPDIVAAEYRVLEAHDLVGQAKLAQLPSISLTGARRHVQLRARRFAEVVHASASSRASTFPLFDPGIKARIKTTEAQTEVADSEYRRTVVAAFEEVENALVNLDAHRRQQRGAAAADRPPEARRDRGRGAAEGRHRVAARGVRDRAVAARGRTRAAREPPADPRPTP